METTEHIIKERRIAGETNYEIAQLLIIEKGMSALDAMCAVGITDKESSIVRVKDYLGDRKK